MPQYQVCLRHVGQKDTFFKPLPGEFDIKQDALIAAKQYIKDYNAERGPNDPFTMVDGVVLNLQTEQETTAPAEEAKYEVLYIDSEGEKQPLARYANLDQARGYADAIIAHNLYPGVHVTGTNNKE